jgi:hypothetical protein
MLSMDAFSSLATRRGPFSPGAGLVMSCDTYGHELTNTTRTSQKEKKKREITRRVTADGTRRAFVILLLVIDPAQEDAFVSPSDLPLCGTKPVGRIIKFDTNLALNVSICVSVRNFNLMARPNASRK